jgi:hypothetical protein
VTDLSLPSLRHFDLTEASMPEMDALAKKSSSMKYSPVVLHDQALAEILIAGL